MLQALEKAANVAEVSHRSVRSENTPCRAGGLGRNSEPMGIEVDPAAAHTSSNWIPPLQRPSIE